LTGILSNVRSQWQGAAAERATSAITPLISWFHSNAANAEASAAQLQTAAASVATGIAGTPHPTQVGENRTTWAGLVATNIFGINTPAINVKDGDYIQMWMRSAFGRATTDVETATATGSLKPWEPPPTVVNMASFGSSAGVAASLANVPESAGMAAVRRATDMAWNGILVEGAAGNAVMAGQARPGTASAFAAAQQAAGEGQPESQNMAEGAGEMGANQLGGMAGQMGGMMSSLAQLPASLGQSLTQPLQGMTQMPMQAGSALQPLMSMFSGVGSSSLNPGEAMALGPMASGIATGVSPASAAFTRPASGGGGLGAGGLRLPSSSLSMPSSAAAGPAGSAGGPTTGIAAGPAAMAGGPGMYGAPMAAGHGANGNNGAPDKYESHTLGVASDRTTAAT